MIEHMDVLFEPYILKISFSEEITDIYIYIHLYMEENIYSNISAVSFNLSNTSPSSSLEHFLAIAHHLFKLMYVWVHLHSI